MALKIQKPGTPFDGEKFTIRYGLSRDPLNPDFIDDGAGFLVFREGVTLPDDPPIFEAPDPPKPARNLLAEIDSLKDRINQLEIDIRR